MKNRGVLIGLSLICFAAIWLSPGTYWSNILAFMGLNAMVAIGLNLLMGYAGQISLGHAGFYGLGAYGSAILATSLKWNPILAIVCATVGVGLMAYIIAYPCFRLKGHYLAMATLGIGIILQICFTEFSSITGGPSGFVGIAPLGLGGHILRGDRAYATLAWILTAVVQLGVLNLTDSKAGRALYSIHDQEQASASLGVDVERYKRQVFAISGALAALAGSIYAFYISFISPETFGLNFSIQLVTMVVIGGMGSVWGPVVGAVLLTGLPEVLRAAKDFDIVVYGLILVGAMAFMPLGLAGLPGILNRRKGGRSNGFTPAQPGQGD